MQYFPDLYFILLVFDAQFTKEKVDKEIEYFEKAHHKAFERTYGWAWLLKLQVCICLYLQELRFNSLESTG